MSGLGIDKVTSWKAFGLSYFSTVTWKPFFNAKSHCCKSSYLFGLRDFTFILSRIWMKMFSENLKSTILAMSEIKWDDRGLITFFFCLWYSLNWVVDILLRFKRSFTSRFTFLWELSRIRGAFFTVLWARGVFDLCCTSRSDSTGSLLDALLIELVSCLDDSVSLSSGINQLDCR
jgi:hypothetical protein